MKSWKNFLFAAISVALLAIGAVWFGWKPEKGAGVPRTSYLVPTNNEQTAPNLSGDETFSVEGGVATSENYMLISSPPNKK